MFLFRYFLSPRVFSFGVNVTPLSTHASFKISDIFPKVSLESIAGKSRVETGRPSSGSPLSMDLKVIIPHQVVSGYNLDLNGWAREI